jgi:hypothetical protein
LVVAACIAGETFGRVDLPAVGVALGGWEDGYEAFAFREGDVGGLGSVDFAGAEAAVKLDGC